MFCFVCLFNILFKRITEVFLSLYLFIHGAGRKPSSPKATLPTAGTPRLASPHLTSGWPAAPEPDPHSTQHGVRTRPASPPTNPPSSPLPPPPSRGHPRPLSPPRPTAELPPSSTVAPPPPRGGWSGGRGGATPAPRWLAAPTPRRRTGKVRQLVPLTGGGSPRSPAGGRGRSHLRGSAPEAGGQTAPAGPQPRPTPNPPTSSPG